jgi:hypothetical protein
MYTQVHGTTFRSGLKVGGEASGKQHKAFKTNKQEKRNSWFRSILLFTPILTEHVLL